MARRQLERPRQAKGITLDLRNRLMAACSDDLPGLRDRALLAVGFETLARASELVALNVEQLQKNHRGTGAILIARAARPTIPGSAALSSSHDPPAPLSIGGSPWLI